MKVRVKIDGRWFDVEVGNLSARPIVADVEGRRFEVWPESRPGATLVRPASPEVEPAPAARPPDESPAQAVARLARDVRAPIPGIILSVSVAAGDTIEPGQELCVLEAMKMRNPIRSPRSGTVARVAVSAGQAVKHHDILLEFTD